MIRAGTACSARVLDSDLGLLVSELAVDRHPADEVVHTNPVCHEADGPLLPSGVLDPLTVFPGLLADLLHVVVVSLPIEGNLLALGYAGIMRLTKFPRDVKITNGQADGQTEEHGEEEGRVLHGDCCPQICCLSTEG